MARGIKIPDNVEAVKVWTIRCDYDIGATINSVWRNGKRIQHPEEFDIIRKRGLQ